MYFFFSSCCCRAFTHNNGFFSCLMLCNFDHVLHLGLKVWAKIKKNKKIMLKPVHLMLKFLAKYYTTFKQTLLIRKSTFCHKVKVHNDQKSPSYAIWKSLHAPLNQSIHICIRGTFATAASAGDKYT